MSVNARDTSRPHVWQEGSNVKTSKTLLLLHGSGADEFDLLSLGKALDPEANLLSVRGLHREHGVNRFFALLEDLSYDEKDVIRNSSELADFLWVASEEYGFDSENVWAVGFSNGANASGALMLLQPQSIAGAILFGNNKVFEQTPFAKAKPDLTGKRVWIANGAQDSYSPQPRIDALIAEYKQLGAQVTFMLHAGGHTISHEHVRSIAADLQQIK